jgi:pimeloyl-ACP methyl ester carboxylesterase
MMSNLVGPIASFVLALTLASSPGRATDAVSSPRLSSSSCLTATTTDVTAYQEKALRITSGDIDLAGRLFLPTEPGPHPAVVLLHGGGLERLNEAPLFYAPLLARCGIAALVYDKRGTGASGGLWGAARFDDFVADGVAAVALLARRADIDARRIGLIGFSQGGRLAPLVAVRQGQVAFVVSVSAPFTSVAETRFYALEQWVHRGSLSGAALDETLALWKKHFAAVAAGDKAALVALDEELREAARRLKASPLPPTSERLPQTPTYNSMGRDYTAELRGLRIPMLAVYGDRDAVVPVERSIEVLRDALNKGGARNLDVQVVPFADHSFTDWTFKQRIKIEETIVQWIVARLAALPAALPAAGTTQER